MLSKTKSAVVPSLSRDGGGRKKLKPKASPLGEAKILCTNKKAGRKYQILDKIEAGIVLTGPETKSAKAGQVNLSDSYAQIVGGEIWLIGAHISPYKFSAQDLDPKRSRKLLLKKQEISHLAGKLSKGTTLIPLKFYLKGNIIKVELGIAKGLKLYNKKSIIREKEIQRDAERELKRFT